METILLFRNSKNGRIECTMYNKTDTPIYAELITKGKFKGCYVDLLRNTVFSTEKSIVKYAPRVNEDCTIQYYFDGNCNKVEPQNEMYYNSMYNL